MSDIDEGGGLFGGLYNQNPAGGLFALLRGAFGGYQQGQLAAAQRVALLRQQQPVANPAVNKGNEGVPSQPVVSPAPDFQTPAGGIAPGSAGFAPGRVLLHLDEFTGGGLMAPQFHTRWDNWSLSPNVPPIQTYRRAGRGDPAL